MKQISSKRFRQFCVTVNELWLNLYYTTVHKVFTTTFPLILLLKGESTFGKINLTVIAISKRCFKEKPLSIEPTKSRLFIV